MANILTKRERIIELTKTSLDHRSVADLVGCSYTWVTTVVHEARKLGLVQVRIGPPSNCQAFKILALARAGKTDSEIILAVGSRRDYVTRILKEAGVERSKALCRPGTKSARIIEMARAGCTLSHIAREAGTSYNYASQTLSRLRDRGGDVPTAKERRAMSA